MRTYIHNKNADFICKKCGYFVSAQRAISGVGNRNHCPFCLYSRHLDLFAAGDRLNACKALMAPVGLVVKQNQDKYTQNQGGELMLLHYCSTCDSLSANRIAADDDPYHLLEVFKLGCKAGQWLSSKTRKHGFQVLHAEDRLLVHTGLFGIESEMVRL